MNSALGLIETQGLVGLIYAIDAMLKAASVELASSIIKLDGGLVSVMIRGDVSSVRAAVEAGAEAAGRVGELKAAHVIPRPGDTVVATVRRGPLMKVLVANLGSTSFKYRLYDLEGGEHLLARGGIERIGSDNAKVTIKLGRRRLGDRSGRSLDHGDAVQICLDQLTDPTTGVLEGRLGGLGDRLQVGPRQGRLGRPARDRGGARGDGGLRRRRPGAQPAVHQGHADARRPVPDDPAGRRLRDRLPPDHPRGQPALRRSPTSGPPKHGIRRWGFHGASHRYIAGRMAELLGRDDLKLISCHLGGSSSICAIKDGKSVATSMGMSPQTGLPQNNRVGDFDVFALPAILKSTGLTLDAGPRHPGQPLGPGRDRRLGPRPPRHRGRRRPPGNEKARLALDVYIASARHYLGAYLVELGGADAIVFTGGIGENSVLIREGVCRDLGWFGIELDPAANASGPGRAGRLDARLAGPGLDRPDQRGDRRRPPGPRPAGRPEEMTDRGSQISNLILKSEICI